MEEKKASELVLSEGKVYHLDLGAEDIADTIILVGDQFRVEIVSSFFDKITHRIQKREFICHTGFHQGKRLSVISTGIGTDNVDIVLNELDAVVNIDLAKRKEKEQKKTLSFIRIGTCGSLQAEIPVGSYILSDGAIGLDNVAHFYEITFSTFEQEFTASLEQHLELPATIRPYFCLSDSALTDKLDDHPNVKRGITVTASGFYGPQGRQLRLPLRTPDLNERLMSFRYGGYRIANFEMESSALFALSRALGHRATTICLALANRPNGNFMSSYTKEMNELIAYVLKKL
jgi:uridine phosphorylase